MNKLIDIEMVLCSRCVMDSLDSRIQFNSEGVCDHCATFDQQILPDWERMRTEIGGLTEMVNAVKASRKSSQQYDCILGMSGGVDSSYLLHLAVVELGLKPLVFHVDAGWNSQLAVNNIERLIDKLGLDLYTEVIDWEEMKDLQLAFFKSGVPHIDVPQDHAFFATMYKYASKYNIKHILTGGNYSTECVRNPLEWMYYQSDSIQLIDIHKRHGTRPLTSYPVTNILWHKVWLPYFRGIKLLRPLDHMEYHKADAMKLLMETYGWQPYPQKHFESRFTRFYESYWLPKRFGYDVRKVQFSSLILTGQMTREEALAELEKPSYDESTIHHEFEYVANKLDITVQELQSYLDMPKRTYRDYKSQDSIYRLGAKTLRWLGIERGGKR